MWNFARQLKKTKQESVDFLKKFLTSGAHALSFIVILAEKMATEQSTVEPNRNPVTHLRTTGGIEAKK